MGKSYSDKTYAIIKDSIDNKVPGGESRHQEVGTRNGE